MQEDVESLGQLCSVLPMLAYGDVAQESWQDLRAGDCVHFIQLAQCALEFMLSQAHDVHMNLVRLILHLLCPWFVAGNSVSLEMRTQQIMQDPCTCLEILCVAAKHSHPFLTEQTTFESL